MRTPGAVLATLPLVLRAVVIGAACIGVVGALVGLVVGLFTYAPTAPFAVVELGLPAAVTGALVGFVVGSVLLAVRAIRQRGGP